jgi:tetratricopeptide (TPR) repeat protein
MRRSTILLSFLLVVLLAGASTADARNGRRNGNPHAHGQAFQLQSELLSRLPEVQRALEAVNENPDKAANWRWLGTVLSERGDHIDALRALDTAVEMKPDDPDTWVDLGSALLRAGELKEAVDVLEEALEIEPFHAIAHYNLGLAHQALDNYDEALDAFQSALLLEPWLGDPTRNPGVVNNPAIDYVKLRVYLETAGATPAIFTLQKPGLAEPRGGPTPARRGP